MQAARPSAMLATSARGAKQQRRPRRRGQLKSARSTPSPRGQFAHAARGGGVGRTAALAQL
eukprot:4597996-Alexandrium_andersonii.AAC.1